MAVLDDIMNVLPPDHLPHTLLEHADRFKTQHFGILHKDKIKPVDIDLEDMEARAFRLPIKRGRFSFLAVNDKNHVVYLQQGEESVLQFFDPNDEKREEKTILKKVGFVQMTPDGKKLLVRSEGKTGIIDERWNGGGNIADRFIELLNRPIFMHLFERYENDWRVPTLSHQGPKCMLINGESGSGGDIFPYLFRKAKLGKLIGMRTWGGVIGISRNPPLIDGARLTVPFITFYETDGTLTMEGHGVDPDIEVVDDPALMVEGGDPQLDAAIQHMLDEIKRNP